MKKAVLILLVAVLALAPAMADSYSGSSEDGSFGIGVNLGTSSGVGMKFGFGDFDLIANVGFDAFHLGDGVGIGGEIGLGYQVYDIKIDRQNHMPVTVGLLMPLGFYFGDNSSFWLGAAIYGGLEGKLGRSLASCTVGVVGTGAIGSCVIRELTGFGCRIIASDPYPRDDVRNLAEYVELDELLARADIVTLHVPGLPENRHMIGAAELAGMKTGAILVNAARGMLVDTTALVDAIESGHLGGAALDTASLARKISALLRDGEVQRPQGIIPYVLTGDERHLDLRAFPEDIRLAAWERQEHRCAGCGNVFDYELMEADHIVPWAKGGRTVEENCQMLCRTCNRRKSAK